MLDKEINTQLLASNSQQPISAIQLVLVFVAFFLAIILIIGVKKIYYRIRYKKRYFIFPRTSVKGIANIAMVVSIAVTAILLLTIVTAGFMAVLFRAYPGWRVTIEGILIKIGGLLFGPIIGLCIGAATDLLSVALTAGMFHYGYFIAAMAYGLIAGLVKTLLVSCKNNNLTFTFWATIISLIVAALSFVYIWYQPYDIFDITLLGLHIVFEKWMLMLIIGAIFGTGLITLWTCLFFYHKDVIRYKFISWNYWYKYELPQKYFGKLLLCSKNKTKVVLKQTEWYAKHMENKNEDYLYLISTKAVSIKNQRGKWFSYFAPVLITIMLGETIIDVFTLPIFDNDFSHISYSYWLAFRIVMLIPMSILNLAAIYPVYRIVAPSMSYNYQNDLVEDLKVPLIAD